MTGTWWPGAPGVVNPSPPRKPGEQSFKKQLYAPPASCQQSADARLVRPERAAARCWSVQVRGRLKSHRRIEYLKGEHLRSQTISRRWVVEMALSCRNARKLVDLDPYKLSDFLASEC
jgi:hypothetical protein